MEPIKSRVLADTGLGLDQSELLLELFRIRQRLGEERMDGEEFTTMKELQRCLLISQAHMSRRIAKVEAWVEVRRMNKGAQDHANSLRVRINAEGTKKITPVWQNYKRLAISLFEHVSPKDRIIHFQVTSQILQKLRPFRNDPFQKDPPIDPVENIMITLKAARELVTRDLQNELLAGTHLSLEAVEILVDLYGAWKLQWPDPKADDEGFVTLQKAQASLVHNIHPSQVQLSRRLRNLEKDQLLTIQKAKVAQKYLSEKDRIRITDKGIAKVQPVWERYKKLAERLLADVTARECEIHRTVSKYLVKQLRPAWDRLD